MRLEHTHASGLVKFTNHYTTRGAPPRGVTCWTSKSWFVSSNSKHVVTFTFGQDYIYIYICIYIYINTIQKSLTRHYFQAVHLFTWIMMKDFIYIYIYIYIFSLGKQQSVTKRNPECGGYLLVVQYIYIYIYKKSFVMLFCFFFFFFFLRRIKLRHNFASWQCSATCDQDDTQ